MVQHLPIGCNGLKLPLWACLRVASEQSGQGPPPTTLELGWHAVKYTLATHKLPDTNQLLMLPMRPHSEVSVRPGSLECSFLLNDRQVCGSVCE